MEESPHGRHDDELRMTPAQLKAAIDAIEAHFNFDTLSASCSEDVKSSRKLYEIALERVRTAQREDPYVALSAQKAPHREARKAPAGKRHVAQSAMQHKAPNGTKRRATQSAT
eukprot:SAG11_NODE_140_length_15009_cov_7.342522_9_plen_113_part_00